MAEEAEKDAQQNLVKEPWQLKEALVVIPFLASALALTWEVGFFLRIKGGAFGLFTISEHITFSLQALPIALMMASAAVGMMFQIDLMNRFIRHSRYENLMLVSAIVVLIALNVYLFIYSPSVAILAMDALGLASVLAIKLSRFLFKKPIVISVLGLFSLFVVTFALGIDSARNELKSKRPLNKIELGEKDKLAPREVHVRILRTGERGVLCYDPATQQFSLLPWDNVRKIEWAISQLAEP
jgi:hypothetical protein